MGVAGICSIDFIVIGSLGERGDYESGKKQASEKVEFRFHKSYIVEL